MNQTFSKITHSARKILPILIPFFLAFIFVAITSTSVYYKSRTRDEARHLVRGVMLLETRDYRLNKHHPILPNTLNALPVVFNDEFKTPETDSQLWENAAKDELSEELIDINSGDRFFVSHYLNDARMVTMVFIAISAIVFYFVIRKEWGLIPAIVFAILYIFSPNIIANSRLVTTDAWIVPFVFGASFLLYKYAKEPKWGYLIGFTLLSFCSLITKYTAVPIAIIWIVLLFIYEFQYSRKLHEKFIKRLLAAIWKPALIILFWILALTAVYGFRFSTLADTNHGDTERTEAHMDNIAGITTYVPFLEEPLQNAYLNLKVPFPEYIQGFFENVILHDTYGHDSFLFGMYANKGWWYYFPATMLVKMPVAVLIGILGLFAAGIAFSIAFVKKFVLSNEKAKFIKKNLKLKPDHVFYLVPLFILGLSMISSVNLGIRHILVIFPFIYLGIALLVKKLWVKGLIQRIIISLLVLWYIASSLFIYPHYLEYFNELVGPKNGYKYLLDSNLSWDQDNFYVSDYILDLPTDTIIHINPLEQPEEGLVIIDVDLLMGRDRNKRAKTAWLREPFLEGEIEPIDRIAYTYLVFEID